MCLVIGAVVIVAVHLLDNRIKSADDIAGVTGVSVLGIIPKLPEEEESLLRDFANNARHGE